MLLSKALVGFLLHKSADGLSPNTARIYRAALSKLVTFTGDADVTAITTDDIRGWFTWLREDYRTPEYSARRPEHLSAATLQQAWRALKSFYSWANSELGIPRVDTVRMPEGESPVIRPFTQDEMKAIVKAAEYTTTKETGARKSYTQRRPTGARNVALVLLLLDSGLRIGEASRLTIDDADLQTGAVMVAPFGSGRKTRSRIVYLGKSARRALWKYLAGRDDAGQNSPLFSTGDDRQLSPESLGRLIRNIGKRAGVKDCHAHKMRHTFSIEYLRNGGDPFTLQKLLGHSSLETVRRYLSIVQGDLAGAHRRASPTDHWRL